MSARAKQTPGGRRLNGESWKSDGPNARGYYEAFVWMGTKSDGTPDRRHVERRTEAAWNKAVRELEKKRNAGQVGKPGRIKTVKAMLDRHLDVVLPHRDRAPKTIIGYRSLCKHQIYPRWGGQRIDRLLPEQLEDGYGNMLASGLATSSVRKVHAILSSAYEIEVRRGNVARNPCKLVEPPRLGQPDKAALSQLQARAVLNAVAGRRNAARWSVGLACGLRQGEALGLRWPYVDLDAGELRVWFQLQRLPWRHGCADVAACTEGSTENPARVDAQKRPISRADRMCVSRLVRPSCVSPAVRHMPRLALSGTEAAWSSGRSRNAAARQFPWRPSSSPSSPLTGRSRNWNATWRRTSGKTTALSSPRRMAALSTPARTGRSGQTSWSRQVSRTPARTRCGTLPPLSPK